MLSKKYERIGRPTIVMLGVLVAATMLLSLCVTATGTARFMAPMGYDIRVGYGVGATLELTKDLFLVAVLALWARRTRGLVLAPPGSAL